MKQKLAVVKIHETSDGKFFWAFSSKDIVNAEGRHDYSTPGNCRRAFRRLYAGGLYGVVGSFEFRNQF